MINFWKKLIISIVIFNFVLGSTGVPDLASAQVLGTGVLPTVRTDIFLDLPAIVKNITNQLIETTKRAAGQIIKKVVINRMVNALIKYINRGFKGGIVVDWDDMLRDAREGALGELAVQAGAAALCGPYNLSLQLSLTPVPEFDEQLQCTLTDLRNSLDSFLKDFKRGGWVRYNEVWAPNNNFFGNVIIAWDKAIQKQEEAEEAQRNEALAGGGFLPAKKCDDPDKPETCRTTVPGTIIGEAGSQALIKIPANSILNASDINSYINVVVDAAVNQLTLAAGKGLNNLFAERPKPPPRDPCATLNRPETIDAYLACRGVQRTNILGSEADKQFLLEQVDLALKPRQEAVNILDSTLSAQEDLVDALKKCPATPEISNRLSLEEQTLFDLEKKFNDNQAFLNDLVSIRQDISSANTEEDATAAVLAFNRNQSAIDAPTAVSFRDSIKLQSQEIQKKVAAELSSIQTSCQLLSS